MRFTRREMMFDKGEFRKKNVAKTVNVAEINEKRRPCTGASRTPGHGGTIPIIGGHQLPSDDRLRGGVGAFFGCNPLSISEAAVGFAILRFVLFYKGNVKVSACKMWEHVKNWGGEVVGA